MGCKGNEFLQTLARALSRIQKSGRRREWGEGARKAEGPFHLARACGDCQSFDKNVDFRSSRNVRPHPSHGWDKWAETSFAVAINCSPAGSS